MKKLGSTNKSNLFSLYRHQKHTNRIIYDKDRFAHTKSLFKHAKALTVYEINHAISDFIFDISV